MWISSLWDPLLAFCAAEWLGKQQEHLACEVLQHNEIGPESLLDLHISPGSVAQNVAEVFDHFEVVHMGSDRRSVSDNGNACLVRCDAH